MTTQQEFATFGEYAAAAAKNHGLTAYAFTTADGRSAAEIRVPVMFPAGQQDAVEIATNNAELRAILGY